MVMESKPKKKEYVYGIKGMADLLGVSESTVERMKKEGVLEGAYTQSNRSIIAYKEKVLQFFDDPAGQQFHFAVRAGEVQIFAGVHDGRAGGAHVDGLRAVVVEEFHGLLELGAPDDGVVDEEQVLVLDELRDGDLLHLGDLVPLALAGRHEGPRPGGGVFDEGAGEGDVAPVGVSDGVGRAGIRDSADVVDILGVSAPLVLFREDLAVPVAHQFHVDALVGGVRVAVIGPEEGADPHFLPGRGQLDHRIRGEGDDLPGAELLHLRVAELVHGKGLEGGAVPVLGLSDHHGQASELVPRGDEGAVVAEDQDRGGPGDLLLGEFDALDEVGLLVDEGRGELGGVHGAAGHGVEVVPGLREVFPDDRVGVLDDADDADGVGPEVGADEKGLGIVIADAADGGSALHFVPHFFEFRAERGVLDVVDVPLQSGLGVPGSHAAAPGAEVGVVVRAEKYVRDRVALAYRAKKSAHEYLREKDKGPTLKTLMSAPVCPDGRPSFSAPRGAPPAGREL